MTPDTEQAPAGRRRPAAHRAGGAAAIRSGPLTAEAARAGHRGAVGRPSHAKVVQRGQEDTSIVEVIPLLAVLVIIVAGVYIAWSRGSAGGGEGGVIGGVALLAAAAARLLLPPRLAGLLAMRSRAKDVVTLTIFGIALLVAGLVLPR
jgi:hypothetical protein